jgi:hypothetical protein
MKISNMLLLLLPDNKFISSEKRNLFELFDIFVGVPEDKYTNTMDGIPTPIFLLRLSSIIESDNAIKFKDDLIELEKRIELLRSKKENTLKTAIEKTSIPTKFLLNESDYIITNRGIPRIISIRKVMGLDTNVEHFAATQQFLYLRPKEETKNYHYKYVDILIQTIENHLQSKQDISKVKNIVLKEGHKLVFDKFEVGQPISIQHKNGGDNEIKDGNYVANILDKHKESKIKFSIKGGIIKEINRSILNVVTVKELESIELNVITDQNERLELIKEYEKLFYKLEEAKQEYKKFTENLTTKIISK